MDADFGSKDDDFRLQEVAAQLADCEALTPYLDYLTLRSQGLRPQSLERLSHFLSQAINWPFPQRRDFTDRVLHLEHANPDLRNLIPQPLRAQLINPTLDEWIRESPQSAAPWRWRGSDDRNNWRGSYDDLRKALQLDPNEQIARERLITQLLQPLNFAVHELPAGYLGDIEYDLAAIDEIDNVCRGLYNKALAAEVAIHSRRLRATIESYKQYKLSSNPRSFAEWSSRNPD